MAELSLDEAQRLARQFLTGQASPADVGRVSGYLAEDQTLALELLSQMQAALDDVAPSALTPEQDRSVDARIEALIGPRIRKRGLLGWLRRLFGRKPKPAEEAAPSRRRRKGQDSPPPEPVVAAPAELPPPSTAASADESMEETMPGLGAPAPAESAPPVVSAEPSAGESAAPAKPAGKPLPWRALGLGLLLLLLLAGLGWGLRAWMAARSKAKPLPVPTAVPTPSQAAPAPTPQPTPLPTVHGNPVRVRSVAGPDDEPLPSQLPPATPQPAGLLSPEP